MQNIGRTDLQDERSYFPVPDCYASKLFQDKEILNIFEKKWLMVGRAEHIPYKGDYFTTEVLNDKIVIVNGEEGIKAFYNTCPHRGMQLCRGSGNTNRIICPYHGWSFNKEGGLVGHPGVTKEDIDFNSSEHGLYNINCEERGGFIWINFDSSCSNLDEQLGDFPKKILEPYNTKDLICFESYETFYSSNWKLYLEAGMEGLHIPHIHKSSIGRQKLEHQESQGDWQLITQPSNKTASLPRRSESKTFDIISTLLESDLKTSFCLVYPNLFIVATLDSVWWAQTWPIEPGKSMTKFGFSILPDEIDKGDFQEKIKNYQAHWKEVISEDKSLVERQQNGIIHSKGLFYTRQEVEVERFHKWIGKNCFSENF